MNNPYNNDNEYRIDLTRTLLGVLSDWDIRPQDQLTLLGMPLDTKPRILNRFRAGMATPDNEEFLQRARYLLAINNAIESFFPHNITAANLWITTRSDNFGTKSPLDIMLLHGLQGMKYLSDLLDGRDEWGEKKQ